MDETDGVKSGSGNDMGGSRPGKLEVVGWLKDRSCMERTRGRVLWESSQGLERNAMLVSREVGTLGNVWLWVLPCITKDYLDGWGRFERKSRRYNMTGKQSRPIIIFYSVLGHKIGSRSISMFWLRQVYLKPTGYLFLGSWGFSLRNRGES